jgi:glycosyltransferase involved in cell wall biosynthesis
MPDFNPIVIIPSYNTGKDLLQSTVEGVLALDVPLLVVVDGSSDGSEGVLPELRESNPQLRILHKKINSGKGAAVLSAAEQALEKGFTHGLTMDSDGQHPAATIPQLLELARRHQDALIAGQPVFGADAPLARVLGRKLTSFWTNLETLWCGLDDTLFGMRVYPLKPLKEAFRQTRFARGFEFDPEIAVRMVWSGCRPIPVSVPVRYLEACEGGVSHFHYLRDNLKLTFLHFRLVPELLLLRLFPFYKKRKSWKKF